MASTKTRLNAEALRASAQKRLAASGALLKRMGVTEEEYLEALLNAIISSQRKTKQGQKTLADCTPESVELALIKCINAGLLPDGEEATLIPQKDGTCRADIGVVGKLRLARQATPGLSVNARTVWRDDHFEHEEGLEPVLRHKPSETAQTGDDNVRAVYVVAVPPGGQKEWEVWYRHQIDRYRAFSRSKSGPWHDGDNYGEMGEKGVIGAVLKRLPKRAHELHDPEAAGAQDEDAATPALEHLPSRTLADVVPGPAAAAAGAQPAQARTKTRATAKPKAEAAPAPPAGDSPPIDSYEDDASPF